MKKSNKLSSCLVALGLVLMSVTGHSQEEKSKNIVCELESGVGYKSTLWVSQSTNSSKYGLYLEVAEFFSGMPSMHGTELSNGFKCNIVMHNLESAPPKFVLLKAECQRSNDGYGPAQTISIKETGHEKYEIVFTPNVEADPNTKVIYTNFKCSVD